MRATNSGLATIARHPNTAGSAKTRNANTPVSQPILAPLRVENVSPLRAPYRYTPRNPASVSHKGNPGVSRNVSSNAISADRNPTRNASGLRNPMGIGAATGGGGGGAAGGSSTITS